MSTIPQNAKRLRNTIAGKLGIAGSTIVPFAPVQHKARWGLVVLLAWNVPAPAIGRAQSPPAERSALEPSRLLSVAAAGVLYVGPRLLNLRNSPPSCAPCNRADVPSFDRWMLGPERLGWSAASTVGLAGLAALTWLHLAHRADAYDHVWASVETVSWALGLTEVAKTAFGRNRPVLYTADAPEAADRYGSRRSLPSGHTAAAFAIAASYWLSIGERSRAARLGALAAAIGVGTLRVAARRHFPSDALAGAALGVATAIVVHEIRF